MATVTTRPDETIAEGGTRVGGGSWHGALSDLSDSTYINLADGENFRVGFADPSIPPGAVIKRVAIRIRAIRVSQNMALISVIYPELPGDQGVTAVGIVSGSAQWYPTNTRERVGIDPDEIELNVGALRAAVSAGTLRVFEAELRTTYVAKPEVTVTAPDGVISDTNRPTVRWTPTLDADGGPQVRYEVKVFDQATYEDGGFNPATSTPTYTSGVIFTGATQHQIASPLADGEYRAYVLIRQTVNGQNHWADWAHSEFEVDFVPEPEVTSLTVTNEGLLNRIEIAGADVAHFELQRSDDGAEFVDVRTETGGGIVQTTEDAIDAEWPNEVDVVYRARAIHASGAASEWEIADPVSADRGWQLVHPTRPELSIDLTSSRDRMRSAPGHEQTPRIGSQQAIGAPYAQDIFDSPEPESGDLVIRCDTNAQRETVRQMIRSRSPLLWIGRESDHHRDRWIVLTNTGQERVFDNARASITWHTIPWRETARPTDPLTAWPEVE